MAPVFFKDDPYQRIQRMLSSPKQLKAIEFDHHYKDNDNKRLKERPDQHPGEAILGQLKDILTPVLLISGILETDCSSQCDYKNFQPEEKQLSRM
jgi:hypothetical protein